MSWLGWLVVAVLIAVVAGVTGLQPKGARPIAHTSMMGVARIVLLALVIIVAYFAYRARSVG
jgi:hypothetical protein